MFLSALIDKLTLFRESHIHNHDDSERADLYHAVSADCPEAESLHFLHALVFLFKPERILDVSASQGLATLAMSTAMQLNQTGKLIALETNEVLISQWRKNVSSFNAQLLDLIELVESDAMEYAKTYNGEPFDFVFFDGDLSQQPIVFNQLLDGGHLSRGALCVFHDTSVRRINSPGDSNESLVKSVASFCQETGCEVLGCPFSRGLTVLRIPAN